MWDKRDDKLPSSQRVFSARMCVVGVNSHKFERDVLLEGTYFTLQRDEPEVNSSSLRLLAFSSFGNLELEPWRWSALIDFSDKQMPDWLDGLTPLHWTALACPSSRTPAREAVTLLKMEQSSGFTDKTRNAALLRDNMMYWGCMDVCIVHVCVHVCAWYADAHACACYTCACVCVHCVHTCVPKIAATKRQKVLLSSFWLVGITK